MIQDEPNTEAIHRMVSNHVLRYIPVSPRRAETLSWPLGFMTSRCKRAAKDLSENNGFTKSEKRVSSKILPWVKKLDVRVKNEIFDLKEEIIAQGSRKGKNFFPPLVLRAKSGFGKSILLGKVVAELIDSKFFSASNEWREFDRIVFSQLKDQTGVNLEYAVCNGMDGYHKCEDLDSFFTKTKGIPKGNKIIVIDSLDEHSQRKSWWDVSKKLSMNGWVVVWACREPDWTHHKLGDEVPEDFYKPSDGKAFHWDRLSGFEWTLKLDKDRMVELNPIIKNYASKTKSDKVYQFVNYCYSKTQLMHIYYTNFEMKEDPRKKLDENLLHQLLKVRKTFRYKNREKSERNFSEPIFYNQFFDYNLAKIIIDTAIDFLKDEDYNASDTWERLCRSYYLSRSKNRGQGQLDESLSYDETDEIPSKFIQRLKLFGILREGYKFRHRDFATIAYVTGCEQNLLGLDHEKKDILFQHFFPYTVLNLKVESQDYGELAEGESGGIVDDFLRRTGNMLSQLELLSNLTDLPKNYIARESILRTEDSEIASSKNKGLSKSQIKSIKLGKNDHCIVLHGVPGSGKTYSGVERILYRQSIAFSEGRTDSYALIVALNKQLAKSIFNELKRQHEKSPFLTKFNPAVRTKIIKSISVKSLDEVIEEWLPLETINSTKSWKIELSNTFDKLKETPKLTVDPEAFRWLEQEFQNNMFDKRTGDFVPKNKFLSKKKTHKKLSEMVREKWYDLIQTERQRGRLSIIEACALLRNRLLNYEHHNSNEREWNADYNLNKINCVWNQNEEFNRYEQLRFYDCIMVDEVQDLPEMAVQMLSFLSPDREPNRFTIAGDKLQTLNGRKFDWKDYLDSLTDMTIKLAEDHAHIYTGSSGGGRPDFHHLSGLFWTDEAVKDVIAHHLDENHRNHPGINNVTTTSWETWPTSEYYDKVKNSYPLEKMESKYSGRDIDNKEFSPLMVIETHNADDFKEKVKKILRFLNSRAKVSLLYTNETIRKYVSERVMKTDKDGKLSVESFTPWTIKGLERNAVVILGAYTASFNDHDTAALWNKDFRSIGEFAKLTDAEKDAIDLMRRKMIVANTRAVEQLVVVNLPVDETNLGSQKYRIRSLVPPTFTSSKIEYRIEKNTNSDKLNEDLKRFFKESKIKPEHISVARLSEGLNMIMRARDESDMREEFEFFKSSLKTILDDDVPNSILRGILSSVLNYSDSIELNRSEVIIDLMELNKSNRKFVDETASIDSEDTNHYSSIISNYKKIKATKSGPWSTEGFNLLYDILRIRDHISEEIKKSKNKHEFEYLDTEASDILDDIENVLDNLDLLIRDFSDVLGLPNAPLQEHHLIVYLFSDKNELNFIPYTNIAEPSFALKIVQSFGTNINFDENGELIYVMDSDDFSGHLKISREIWNEFLKDLSLLQFGKSETTSQSEFVPFAKHLVRIHHKLLSSKNLDVSLTTLSEIRISNANAINYLVSLNYSDALDKCKNQVIEFIKREFQGMEDEATIKKFLRNIILTNQSLLNEVGDKYILHYHFKRFNLFINALKSAALPRFVDRARNLISKADYVNRLLGEGFVSIQSLHTSIFNVGKVLIQKVQEEKTYAQYEILIEEIKRDIMKGLMQNQNYLNINLLANKQWRQMSILRRIVNFMGHDFGSNYDLDSKIFGKLSEEFLQEEAKETRLEISSLLSKLENQATPNSPIMEKLLRNILFAQYLASRNPKLMLDVDSNISQFPILQQAGVFKLDNITRYSRDFGPNFNDDNEERDWVQGNRLLTFFPSQRDRIDHMKLVSSMTNNWDAHFKLYSALYDHDDVFTKENLAWRFEGFGELIPFSEWVNINEQIRSGTSSEENVLTHVFILNEYFDFTTRIENYVKVIEAYLEVLESRNTKTIGIKVLLQESLSNILSLQDIIKSKGIDYDFDVKAFPQGKELTVTIKKNGKLKIQSWAQDVPDIIRLTGYLGLKGDKLDREESIDSLKLQLEVLREYLELEKTELLEKTESAQNHGNLIIEGANNIDEMLANVARETAKESAEKMTVLVTEEDFNRHVDSLDDDGLEESVEVFNQESEEFDNDIDDYDREVLSYWGNKLTEEAWVEMEEHIKQFYRDEYETLG